MGISFDMPKSCRQGFAVSDFIDGEDVCEQNGPSSLEIKNVDKTHSSCDEGVRTGRLKVRMCQENTLEALSGFHCRVDQRSPLSR